MRITIPLIARAVEDPLSIALSLNAITMIAA